MLIRNRDQNPILTNSLVKYLSSKGIYLSTGSACSTLSKHPSHVLQAIQVDPAFYNSSLRISLGDWITPNDIDYASNIIQESIDQIGIN